MVSGYDPAPNRAPDMILKVMNKTTGQKSGRIGCAWVNPNGAINIRIDFPNVLQDDPSGVLLYMLFPKKEG